MNNDINEKIVHAAPVPPFVTFVASAVPMVFDNSMSYYEALCALWKWLQDDVIDVINNNASVTEQYIEYDLHTRELFIELKSYVDNYFDNLDVQEEINNKLDAMVEDGTFSELFSLMYPVKDEETGVVNAFFEYGDVKRYGAVCDGATDDKTAINNAITSSIALNCPVKLHGMMYVSETINTHGAFLQGDKQPTQSGAYYPDGIGYDYAKNANDGAMITFANYISTIPDGTCIVSNTASPILSTDYDKGFKLKNFGVYGWLRNTSQIGVEVNEHVGATYYQGHHEFTNFSVFNTGSHAIHLHSIETTDIENVIVELTNGYGIYIEGLADTDTPSDYTVFRDCRIRYTRLHGIYFYNTIRNTITFEHCNFNYIGQYSFGSVNDDYGTRSLPVDNASAKYPISINGLNSVGATQLRYLNLFNNYGEANVGFVNIENITTISGLSVKDNSITKYPDASVGCYLRSDVHYLIDCEISYITSNLPTLFEMGNILEIRTQKVITDQLYNVLGSSVFYKDVNKFGYAATKSLYTNTVTLKETVLPYTSFNALSTSASTSQELTIDLKPYINTYLSSNQSVTTGHAFTTALIGLANAGNSASASKVDLVTMERHNGKYFVGFVTNNTGATVDDAGVMTITCPAYKVVTLQFIQQVNTSIQN